MTEATAPMFVNWLAFSQNAEVALSLSREEARRRAGELRRLISDGLISAKDVALTEESKDVLWALAELISESSDAEPRAHLSEADRIYRFVRELDWTPESFDEQQEILRRIAVAGWAAVGLTLEDVAGRRQTDFGAPDFCGECQAPRAPEGMDGFSFNRDATEAANFYLVMDSSKRSGEVRAHCLADIDAVLAICRTLKHERDRSPEKVAAEAVEAYEFVSTAESVGLFDDRNYVLGELAHLAGGAKRFLGQREQVEFWLCRAEAAFRQTIDPTGSLTQVSYTRLALMYDMGRHEDVLELLPDVQSAFAELGMVKDCAKARFFQAVVLKALNRLAEANRLLKSMAEDPCVNTDNVLFGRILVDLGDTEQLLGHYENAVQAFRKALPLLQATRQPMAVADLQAVVGSAYRNLGRLSASEEAFAQSKSAFAGLGMQAAVAYISVLRADVLLAAARYREAEMELLGALSVIEEQKMVPEGFAAVALLKESIRRRKTDPNALRELREHLQANR